MRLRSTSSRTIRRRRSAAPASAASAASAAPASWDSQSGPPPSRSRRPRSSARSWKRARSSRYAARYRSRTASQDVPGVGQRPRRLRVQLVEPASDRVAAGQVHRGLSVAAAPGTDVAGDAEHAHVLRSRRLPRDRRAPAGSPPGSRPPPGPSSRRGSAASRSRRPRSRSAAGRRTAGRSRGRGRPRASRTGRASVGTRSVSASQIGKSWITGVAPSSGRPCAASSRARTS